MLLIQDTVMMHVLFSCHPHKQLYWELEYVFLLCVFILLLHIYTLYILQCRLRIVDVYVCV